MLSGIDFIELIFFFLIPLWFSLSVHEWAHAWSAYLLGDDTASLQGRMTINPLAHIDPIGTLILPLMGVPFGWAKPVPVNPVNFTRKFSMRASMMLTALAGPLSNIMLAIAFGLIFKIVTFIVPDIMHHSPNFVEFIIQFFRLNIILAAFNLFPIPPLDGSRVADYFMPQELRPTWEKFYNSGPIILIVAIVLSNVFGLPIFGFAFDLANFFLRFLLF